MNRIIQAFVWLRRIGHCRGFGIQSPTDYSFVKDVINEQSPYYAYSEVGVDDTWLRQKLGRLYMRIANYIQPDAIVDYIGYDDYLHAGCRKADIVSHPTSLTSQPSLFIVQADDVSTDILNGCLPQTMLVVENIGAHKQQWQKVVQWPAATITYDLYYCGIATFNPQRARQHYTVNF